MTHGQRERGREGGRARNVRERESQEGMREDSKEKVERKWKTERRWRGGVEMEREK